MVSSLIASLKATAAELGVAYASVDEVTFARKLMTDSSFVQFCERMQSSPEEMAISIMRRSVTISYRKGPCA